MLTQRINDSSLDRATTLYFKELRQTSLLSPEEEKSLSCRARAGDKVAEQKLIESNLRFVVKVAKQFRRSGLPLLDLVNEGNLGLIEAVRRFDPAHEVRFVTYAVWWIRQAILSYISRAALCFRVSAQTANTLYRVSRAFSKNAGNTDLTDEKLAAIVGVSVSELRKSMQAISGTVSLDHPARDGNKRELEGILRQESSEVPDTVLSNLHLKRKISRVLSILPATEQSVLRLRFGLDDDNPLTLREIGERLCLSRERIRQLETSALRKVRESPASRDLALYLN